MYYELYKCNRKGSDFFGKLYGRASIVGKPVTTKALAKAISEKCTVTYPDILAVVSALEEEIAKNVQAGRKVVLDDFGSFKLGLKTAPADSPSKFGIGNVKGIHTIFQPITNVDPATGKHYNAFTHGCTVESKAAYEDPAAAEREAEKNAKAGE